MFPDFYGNIEFDSTSVGKELPIFNKLDANTPLELEISAKDV